MLRIERLAFVKRSVSASLLAATALSATAFVGGSLVIITPALAVECQNSGAGGAVGDDGGNQNNTACGRLSEATGNLSSAFGWEAGAYASESVAVGAASQVDVASQFGIAIGRNAHVIDQVAGVDGSVGAVAIGQNAQASNDDALAFGQVSVASGERAIAIGRQTTSTGQRSVAIGSGADATSYHAVAIGGEANAGGGDATAIGYLSAANHTGASAFGTGATTTRDNQQMFGTAANTYTMAGINSATSKAAQTGTTYLVTSDAGGNLATTNFSVAQLSSNLSRLGEGVAMGLAMGSLDIPDGRKFAMNFGYSNFDGSNAAALQAAVRILDTKALALTLQGGFGVGFKTGVAGGTMGATLAW